MITQMVCQESGSYFHKWQLQNLCIQNPPVQKTVTASVNKDVMYIRLYCARQGECYSASIINTY